MDMSEQDNMTINCYKSMHYTSIFGSCLKTGQHFIFVIIYLLLPINCTIWIPYQRYCLIFLLPITIIMILIMKILLHNEYKIINWWYPTYVYQFFNFPYNYKNRVLACFQTRPQFSFYLQAIADPPEGSRLRCLLLLNTISLTTESGGFGTFTPHSLLTST